MGFHHLYLVAPGVAEFNVFVEPFVNGKHVMSELHVEKIVKSVNQE